MSAHAAQQVTPRTVVGRYALQAELGRGGMATVYRAFDVGRRREIALKVLERSDERLITLFEREFETLAALSHPRVIAVYDFGVTDEGKRFYTMELLEGEDLYALSPLPWAQVCAYVRDVCTSLVLLHAQRLLHRDVNPRNVRLTGDGHAKLIDFGALTEFGVAHEAVGTASCVAPEVLRGAELDQRTDLFSLGAVMYFALTGRAPYAATSFADAEAAWRTPPVAPSEHVPEIPRALDELVLSLLSLDAMSRPVSAAEVADRLGALAQLDDELLSGLAASHVSSPLLSGREREQAELSRVRTVARAGVGGVVLLEAEPGAGRTRLLAATCIDAQVAGLSVVRITAPKESDPEIFLKALVEGLCQAAPREATCARAPYGEPWEGLSPTYGASPSAAEAPAGRAATKHDAHARYVRLHADVAAWIADVARARPLLVAVDDAHHLSPLAAGLLPMLAQVAQQSPLFLLVTRRRDASAPPAVSQLGFMGVELSLAPLDHLACSRLVRSVFGDVPHRARLEQWLMRGAAGNPGKMTALLGHLLKRKIIRYAGGAWTLPHELSDAELEEAQGTAAPKLTALSGEARQVASLLALQTGAMPKAVLLRADPRAGAARVRGALDELLRAGVAVEEDGAYRIANARTREQLEGALTAQEQTALHRAVAEALRELHGRELKALLSGRAHEPSTPVLVELARAGLHLLRGGEEALGTRILRLCAVELTVRGEGLMDAAPELEAAIRTYRALGRARHTYAALMTVLTLAGTYSDFRLGYAYGEELLDLLAESAGFKLASRLERFLPGPLALALGLMFGLLRFYLIPSRRVTASFREVLLGLIGIGSAVVGACPIMQDYERAHRVCQMLRMLRYFPAQHPAREVHEFQLALRDHAFGRYRECRDRCRAVLTYLGSDAAKRALREDARQQLEAGVYIVLSQLDALRVDPVVQKTLAAISALQTSTSAQTRAAAYVVHHGHRGERAAFLKHLDEMDRLATESGATWRNDVQVPRMMWSTYAMCEDILSLKRAVQQLERLAQEMPTVALMRDVVHACYLGERGLADEALTRYAHVFEAPHEGLRGVQYRTAYVRLLRKAGQVERARELCERILSELRPEDFVYRVLTFALERELVLTLVAAGERERAREAANQLLYAQAGHDNQLLIGLSHGARAEVALLDSDLSCFEHHVAQMRDAFQQTGNPALLMQAQKLLDRGRALLVPRVDAGGTASEELTIVEGSAKARSKAEPATLFSAVASARAQGGYLFTVKGGALELVEATCELPGEAALGELARLVREEATSSFKTELSDLAQRTAWAGAANDNAVGAPLAQAWLGHQAYWLPVREPREGEALLGVLVLLTSPETLVLTLRQSSVNSLTRALQVSRAG